MERSLPVTMTIDDSSIAQFIVPNSQPLTMIRTESLGARTSIISPGLNGFRLRTEGKDARFGWLLQSVRHRSRSKGGNPAAATIVPSTSIAPLPLPNDQGNPAAAKNLWFQNPPEPPPGLTGWVSVALGLRNQYLSTSRRPEFGCHWQPALGYECRCATCKIIRWKGPGFNVDDVPLKRVR